MTGEDGQDKCQPVGRAPRGSDQSRGEDQRRVDWPLVEEEHRPQAEEQPVRPLAFLVIDQENTEHKIWYGEEDGIPETRDDDRDLTQEPGQPPQNLTGAIDINVDALR